MFIVSLFATAVAGPLHDIAQIEYDNAREIHRSVKTAEVGGKVKLTAACTDAHGTAAPNIEKARNALDAGQEFDAYTHVHDALTLLKPCAVELSQATKSYQIGVKAVLRTSDAQLAALTALSTEKPSDELTAALEKAKAAKEASRAHALAGETPQAIETWFGFIDAIYVAVKAAV